MLELAARPEAPSVPGVEAGTRAKGQGQGEQASERLSEPCPCVTCRSFGLDSGWHADQKETLLPWVGEKGKSRAGPKDTESPTFLDADEAPRVRIAELKE